MSKALQISSIISRLLSKTSEGDLSWAETIKNRSFQTRLGDFSVTITGPDLMDQDAFIRIGSIANGWD